MKKCLLVLLFLCLASTPCFAQKWSFAVVSDNCTGFSSYRNVLNEIKALNVNPPPAFPSVDFVLGCGDLSPVSKNDAIYRRIFKVKPPPFFPVRGNHEDTADLAYCIRHILPASGKEIKLHGKDCMSYYVDWKNIRLIVLDQYCDFLKVFDGMMARRWLENAIESAKAADHIFIAMHEPVLPTDLTGDWIWNILFKHKDKVRAVFAGHYHFYDHKRFYRKKGSIDYINTGNAGQTSHSDHKQTIVEVMIDGPNFTFRVVQAPDESKAFKLKEQWGSSDTGRDEDKPSYSEH